MSHDVSAFAVFFEHCLDATNLALNAAEATMEIVFYVLFDFHGEPLSAKEAALASFSSRASSGLRTAMAAVFLGHMTQYLLDVGSAASPTRLAAFLACHLSTHTP